MAGRWGASADRAEDDVPALHPIAAAEVRRDGHDLVVGVEDGAVIGGGREVLPIPGHAVVLHRLIEAQLVGAVGHGRPGGDRHDHAGGDGSRPRRGQEAGHQALAGWLAVGETSSALTTRRWRADPFGWQVVRVSVWPGVWAITLKSLAGTGNGSLTTL